MSAGRPAQLTASASIVNWLAVNWLDPCSPGNRAYCYAELTVSPLGVAETIVSTHCTNPRRDGQAELTWEAGYIPRWFVHQ